MTNTIKKIVQIILAFLVVQESTAQKKSFSYGIKAGFSFGKIAIFPPLQNRTERYEAGLVGGGVAQFAISKKYKIQIEPLYNFHHSSNNFNPSSSANVNKIILSLHQISLPIQLSYFIVPSLSLNAGVSGNYNYYFSQKVIQDFGANLSFDITNQIVKFQSGVLGGITFYTKNLLIDARYNRLLGNSYIQRSDLDNTVYHFGNFQLSLGYMF